MTGEERDRLEHEEALKRFGGKMPFSAKYTPLRCFQKRERKPEGQIKRDSKKWDALVKALKIKPGE